MAAGQLASLSEFVEILRTYDVGSPGATAGTLIAVELLAATGMLAARTRRAGSLAAVGVATLWSLLALQAFARGLEIDNCGCFGAYLSQPLRWWVLVQDALFVAAALWAVHGARAEAGKHDTVGTRAKTA